MSACHPHSFFPPTCMYLYLRNKMCHLFFIQYQYQSPDSTLICLCSIFSLSSLIFFSIQLFFKGPIWMWRTLLYKSHFTASVWTDYCVKWDLPRLSQRSMIDKRHRPNFPGKSEGCDIYTMSPLLSTNNRIPAQHRCEQKLHISTKKQNKTKFYLAKPVWPNKNVTVAGGRI